MIAFKFGSIVFFKPQREAAATGLDRAEFQPRAAVARSAADLAEDPEAKGSTTAPPERGAAASYPPSKSAGASAKVSPAGPPGGPPARGAAAAAKASPAGAWVDKALSTRASPAGPQGNTLDKTVAASAGAPTSAPPRAVPAKSVALVGTRLETAEAGADETSGSRSSPLGKVAAAAAAPPEAVSARAGSSSLGIGADEAARGHSAAEQSGNPLPSGAAVKQGERSARAASAQLQQELMREVRTAVTDLIMNKATCEEAHVVVRPGLKRPFAKESDRVAVPELDLGNVEVICRVIGQSAALDFYTSKVDDSLRDFGKVLAELAADAGKPYILRPWMMSRLRGGQLLATIASSSLMYNKVVSKLGLLDTSRTAWESDDHDMVWKRLKKDYELEHRFENLSKKLDIYKEESRFILEVRNERGSAAAEKVIIILIALEIVVNALFHLYH